LRLFFRIAAKNHANDEVGLQERRAHQGQQNDPIAAPIITMQLLPAFASLIAGSHYLPDSQVFLSRRVGRQDAQQVSSSVLEN
jgi:hypothetical protein